MVKINLMTPFNISSGQEEEARYKEERSCAKTDLTFPGAQ